MLSKTPNPTTAYRHWLFFFFAFILSAILLPSCSEESVLQFNSHDTRKSLFPLAEGSYWKYSDEVDEVDSILSSWDFNLRTTSSTSMPLPVQIVRRDVRHYYPELTSFIDRQIEGPAPVWFQTVNGNYDMGYMVNDTAVFSCFEMEGEINPEVVIDILAGYIPLQPRIGQAYSGLRGCFYIGTVPVQTPAYSGPAHLFSQTQTQGNGATDTISFWFAEGVGMVKFKAASSNPHRYFNRSIVLTNYHIGNQ